MEEDTPIYNFDWFQGSLMSVGEMFYGTSLPIAKMVFDNEMPQMQS